MGQKSVKRKEIVQLNVEKRECCKVEEKNEQFLGQSKREVCVRGPDERFAVLLLNCKKYIFRYYSFQPHKLVYAIYLTTNSTVVLRHASN